MSRRRAILLFFPLCRTVKATEKIGQRHIAKSTAELYELLYEFLYFFRAKKFSSLLSPFTARNTNPLEIISSDLNSIGFYIPVYNRALKFQNFSKLSKMTEKNHSLVISKNCPGSYLLHFKRFHEKLVCSSIFKINYYCFRYCFIQTYILPRISTLFCEFKKSNGT